MSSPNAAAGVKRKRASEQKFYAVRKGFKPGVYMTWGECFQQVKSFPGATFKSFPSMADAEMFVKNGLSISNNKTTMKWYAVKNGRVPGIYTEWSKAEEQIKGWKMPKYKSFPTKAEAEAYIRGAELGNPPAPSNEEAPAAKKPKKPGRKSAAALEAEGATQLLQESLEPGTGPLPPSAEDGFDSRIKLNAANGKIEFRSSEELEKTKMFSTGMNVNYEMHIYTDGCCRGNGRNAARAGVGVYFGPGDPRNLAERLRGRQTNQRAELTAIQRALEIAPRNQDVCIHSDSNYSIMCVTEWCYTWRRNNWLNASRKPVENRDLVENILNLMGSRANAGANTRYIWVKGHSNDPGNDAADALANEGANKPARYDHQELPYAS